MWRDLINRKRAGLGHENNKELAQGELALFCPACPQPGVNLPAEWANHYNRLVFAFMLYDPWMIF